MKLIIAIAWLVIAQGIAAQTDSSNIRAAAVDLGRQVEKSRLSGVTEAATEALLEAAEALNRQARSQRIAREQLAGEDEASLEALYRSPVWSDIGFALAASRYWSSWLKLDRFQLTGQPGDLMAAQHGFQTTLALIVYPGLVRGSWLGLGFTAVAAHDLELARTWFQRVRHTDDQLAKTAQRELVLIDALATASDSNPSISSLDATAAAMLESEALALLERHGQTADGALAAAQRILQLENAGALNADRVSRLLVYRDDIIGHDIGPIGLLVSAEDALDHQQYYTAVQKYRAFFNTIEIERSKEFAAYRLRYADALILSGLPNDAYQQLSATELAGLENQTENQGTRTSLLHLAVATQYAYEGTEPTRTLLLQVSARASDFAAQVMRELLTGKLRGATTSWRTASQQEDPWLKRLPMFELTYRELLRAQHPIDGYERAQGELADIAALGRDVFKRLPKQQAREPWFAIAYLEMEGFETPAVDVFLRQFRRVQRKAIAQGSNAGIKNRLFGVRIRYLARMDGIRLVAELRQLTNPTDDAIAILMANVINCDHKSWCLDVTRQLVNVLQDLPQHRLLAELQFIRLLTAADDALAAYDRTIQLLADYPDSGDVWQVYAVAARAVGRAQDADHAYVRISQGVPLGSSAWHDAMMGQMQVRLGAGETQAACNLLRRATSYGETLTALQSLLEDSNLSCDEASQSAP